MEYLKILTSVSFPFVVIYLISKSKIMESKVFNLVLGMLFSSYALAAWIDLQFINYIFLKEYEQFGLIKALSIMQLCMALLFWFYFFDKFINKHEKE